MSTPLDETAADVPVRDVTINLSRLAAGPQDSSLYQNARARQDISRVSREELEDRFLRLHEETLHLKQHIHQQDDKIKKLGTKLMRLVKDRGRMEQLAVGGGQSASRVRDVEMEEMMEELQEKVRGLQTENEGLKQRLLLVKKQLVNSQSRRPMPYGHVHSRVNSGLKKLRDDASSPSQPRPKSSRSLEGGGRPPTGLLPRYGHNLLEEARAEIRNLENVIELQRSNIEEMEASAELLQNQLKRKEAEYEEKLLQVRQQQTSNMRSHVNNNVTMIKLQKQLADRSSAVTELEVRFLHLQESQRSLKASHDTAMTKVDELSAQLKDERLKSLDMEKQLQSSNMTRIKMEQLQERISEVEQERDLLKENNQKLVNSAFDVSQQQKWQIQEQQLKLQIVQLEAALKADLIDKNEILDKIKAERDKSEKLTEENRKLHVQCLEQKQQLEELNQQLKLCSADEYDAAELTEALLLIKSRKSQHSGDLSFLKEVEDGASAARELRAAHAETIQELQKTRNLLNMESKICRDYKAELEAVLKKMDGDRVEHEQQLQRQAQLLDTRAAKIQKLEAQLQDVAYGTKTYIFRPDVVDEDDDETLRLERGENLLELQIVGATLSPAAMETLGDCDPFTFCTYAFYLFELHSSPVVMGHKPKYGFTSKYVVTMDEHFLEYLRGGSVTVELHQALGLDWRTLASGQLPLQQLLQWDGTVHGTVPLVGSCAELQTFGSLDYWLRLRIPVPETLRLFKEKVKAVAYIRSSPSLDSQLSGGGGWNELVISVQRCRDLQPRGSQQPSPYVVYKFSDFPDYPTATIHDCCAPDFNDRKAYSIPMDADLHRYLKSEVLQFYVFDYKEEQLDEYVGKARVPLLGLTQDQEIGGVFELTDHSGCHAGRIDVTLRWKLNYITPSAPILTADESTIIPTESTGMEEHPREEQEEHPRKEQEQDKQQHGEQEAASLPEVAASKLRHEATPKDGAAKRVTFLDQAEQQRVQSAAAQTTEEEEEDEESHFSEGQLVAGGSQSDSDDTEISEEIMEDVEEAGVAKEDQTESTQSDSDDCIVHGPAAGRKASERLRVEVLSLSLRPGSRVARDDSVVRLFVEYSLLDLPTEETPLSLPKPPQGKSINYNYSKVIPVDTKNNDMRRRLLRGVLTGQHPQLERIRFTVVSEPPEEEEQDRECEDVGVAFLRITEVLERQEDLTETSLTVVDVEDSSEVVGTLTVSVEGLEALQAIMEEQEHEQTPVSFQFPPARGNNTHQHTERHT